MDQGEQTSLLRIFIGEGDRFQNGSLREAIVGLAREERLAGVTVLRGLEGFGPHAEVHKARFFHRSRSEDLPLVVEIVDHEDRIRTVLPRLREMIGARMATLEQVSVVYHGTSGPGR